MLTTTLKQLEKNKKLTEQEAIAMLESMLEEQTPNEQIAACMVLLNQQLDNTEMMTGIAKAMRKNMTQVPTNTPVLDIVGTGGDGANTINISTGSALLMSACGVKVAKHGNRSVSSACGSADVLEALGYSLEQTPSEVQQSIEQYNFGFCFAPCFHPALHKLRQIRKALNVPTVFNLMGPLLNPANAEYLMIGVYQESLLDLFANVLAKLPIKKALVFHSEGLDELTCIAPAKARLVEVGAIQELIINPQNYGLPACQLKDLIGGKAEKNTQLLQAAFKGKSKAIANTLILNAGIGLKLYGTTETIQQGIEMARRAINSKLVIELLNAITPSVKAQHESSPKHQRKPFHSKLKQILKAKEQVVAQLQSQDTTHFKAAQQYQNKSFKQALQQPGLSIIAEIKRRSPSKGDFAKINNPVELAKTYADAGAQAISVLTDPHFSGTMQDLRQVTQALSNSDCCVLRKDFIIDPIQIDEAKYYGADAVLLIAGVLGKQIKPFLEHCHQQKIEALVEVHNTDELEIALEAGAEIIGINNRDLHTFEVDTNNALKLLAHLQQTGHLDGGHHKIITVAESGIFTPELAQQYYRAGFDAVLVGEALVTAKNSGQLLKAMRGELNE